MNAIPQPPEAQALRDRYQDLAGDKPPRARNAAQQLGVSELELVAAGCGCDRVVPLKPDFRAMFPDFTALGDVMALSRNEACVHERHGTYESVNARGHAGLVLGPDIDLRVFFAHWHHGYAVSQNGRDSLQFFDQDGLAIHKIYRVNGDADAWHDWVQAHAGESASSWPVLRAVPPVVRDSRPEDAEAFRRDWLAMQDTHDFFPLLRRNNLARQGALECVGADLAQRVADNAVETTLEAAAASELSIMCFVGNRGIVQIHTGPVHNLKRTGPWYNVLDPRFNLHLNTEALTSLWVVNKPTADGWVTSLEAYDAYGELVVQFFGARKPGVPELPAWRELMKRLCHTPLREER